MAWCEKTGLLACSGLVQLCLSHFLQQPPSRLFEIKCVAEYVRPFRKILPPHWSRPAQASSWRTIDNE